MKYFLINLLLLASSSIYAVEYVNSEKAIILKPSDLHMSDNSKGINLVRLRGGGDLGLTPIIVNMDVSTAKYTRYGDKKITQYLLTLMKITKFQKLSFIVQTLDQIQKLVT